MKPQPKPIKISPELAARFDGTNAAERMDAALRAVLSTPHSAVLKDTKKRQKERAKRQEKGTS